MDPVGPHRTARERRLALLALPLCAIVYGCALNLPAWLDYPRDRFAPGSALTHTAMILGSVLIAALLAGPWRARLGLLRGGYRFRPAILLWVLPTAIPSILSALGGPAGAGSRDPFALTPPRTILFVWLYASVAEELLYRGLLQGLLAAWSERGVRLFGRWFLGLPVWISAIAFGLGHLPLWRMMGPMTIAICLSATALGLIAGHYRQQSRSLLPAVIVHTLFNIGGTLPGWLLAL